MGRCSFCGLPGDEEGVGLVVGGWGYERAAVCRACVEGCFADLHDAPMPVVGLAFRDVPRCDECGRWRPRSALCGRLQAPGVDVVVTAEAVRVPPRPSLPARRSKADFAPRS